MRLLSISLLAMSIMTFAACRSTQPTPLGKLIGPTWVLSSVMGVDADASKFSAGLPTLNFLEGERLAGFAGCNHFSGSYMLIGQEVKLHPGAITKKACEGSGEGEFLTAVRNAKTFSVQKEKLTFGDGATELMSFTQKRN
jgi:heat shock protein HslJ